MFFLICVCICCLIVVFMLFFIFFFKQKTAYEMRISDWSSDVCSSDLIMGGFSIWHWLIVLVIVALIFGTKKLRNMGEDLGGAVKGFKKGKIGRASCRERVCQYV